MSLTEDTNAWQVRVEKTTVVVELPRGLELDGETGKQINEAFVEAVRKPQTDSVLTLLRVENAMSSGLFEEVKRGAALAGEHGIDRWAITVERKIKGMAFESNIDGLETSVFEDESKAREWLGSR